MAPPSEPDPRPDPRRKNVVIGAVVAVLVVAAIALLLWPPGAPETPRPRRPAPTETAPEFASIPKIDVHVHVAPMLAERAIQIEGAEGIEVAINASGGVPGQ